MMNPPPSAPAAAPPMAPAQFPSPEDLAQIEHDTGYDEARIMADIKATGATSAADLYPNLYGEGAQGIQPEAAQLGGGYQPEQPPPAAAPEPSGDNPRRAMAQRAMAGETQSPQSPNAMSPVSPDYQINRAAGMAPTDPTQPHAEPSPDDDMRERAALATMAQQRRMPPHKMKRPMPQG